MKRRPVCTLVLNVYGRSATLCSLHSPCTNDIMLREHLKQSSEGCAHYRERLYTLSTSMYILINKEASLQHSPYCLINYQFN